MNNQLFSIKSLSRNLLLISGYASVFNVTDAQNDIMLPNAFLGCVAKHKKLNHIKFLWQHDVTKILGKITYMQEDAYGLFIRAEINANTILGKEVTALIKQKVISALSIGFIPIKTEQLHYSRLIKKVELYEVSVVTFPANSEAQIRSISSESDGDIDEKEISIDKISLGLDQALTNVDKLLCKI